MSLKYRDSQGNETPVAGLNGTSGELVPSVSVIRSGTYTPSGPVQVQEDLSFSVTFSEPMPDNDYQVIFGSSSNNTSSGTIQCAVRSRDTTGFTGVIRNVGVDAIPVASGIFTWFAFKLMTDEVHEADSAHIAQNTANFAPAFNETTSYAVGDYVTYNNVLYRCTTAHTAGVWVAGHFTQVTVGGDIASINSKIPSTASSTEKLAYVEYSPNTSLYSTWEELLELIYQHGNGYWTGTIYIGRWYTYTAKITIGTLGYWYGSFLAKSAEDKDLVGASKIYGATNTWTVSHYVTESETLCKVAQKNSIAAVTAAMTWETIDSVSVGEGAYLIMFRVFWNNAQPLKIRINGGNASVTNDGSQQISTMAYVSGERTLDLQVQFDTVNAGNNYEYTVYKIS